MVTSEKVFKYFREICSIPHGSGNTKAISDYCVRFAAERGLEYYQDSLNNIIIKKNASEGAEDRPPVIIQGHLDMVCEKLPEIIFDFEKDSLKIKEEGDFICAEGTTLGGDDGIAIAYALAVLDSSEIVHPPLECVFTVDEETGMYGAAGLDASKLSAKTLLNIDSEEEGIFTVSCAGGRGVYQTLRVSRTAVTGEVLSINISGLKGGHSGVEIHHGRANAVKILSAVLKNISGKINIGLAELGGGLKDNAIPAFSECEIVVKPEDKAEVIRIFNSAAEKIKKEFSETDPDMTFNLTETGEGEKLVLDEKSFLGVMALLCENPNGVISMSEDIEGLVKTSLNMGVVRLKECTFTVHLSLRSSSKNELEELTRRVSLVAAAVGAEAEPCGSYPPWELNTRSEITRVMRDVYIEQYGSEPTISAIHAGLECGILCDKIPQLDCISFGPDMYDIHTPRERLSISSANRVWEFLQRVLKALA